MSEVYSGTLGVVLMVTGTDNNTWGTLCNSSVFQIFEDAIANVLTEVLTGGTLDLSGTPPPAGPSQTRYAAITVSGTLGSNQIIIVPNLTKVWWVKNSTAGAFTLKFKTTSGSASVAIPQNSGWQTVSCDGANNVTVSPFNSAQVQMPDGSLAAPAYSNINETNSGWYRFGTQDWRLVINGVAVLQATGTGAVTPSVFNILSPNVIQQAGSPMASVSGAVTTNNLAVFASGSTVKDGGVAGLAANANSITQALLAPGAAPLPYVAAQTNDNLHLLNDVTLPSRDINVTAGRVRDDSDVTNLQLAATLFKRLDTAWAAGGASGGASSAGACDTGTKGASQTWHTFLIGRIGLTAASQGAFQYARSGTTVTITLNTHGFGVGTTTRLIGINTAAILGFDGLYQITAVTTNTFTYTSTVSGAVVAATPPAAATVDGFDVLCSQSYSSPSMPAGWTVKQCLGSVITDGSTNIVAFTQVGDEFWWKTPVLDFNGAVANASATTVTLTLVPNGVSVFAFMNMVFNGSPQVGIYVKAISDTDTAPASGAAPLEQMINPAAGVPGAAPIRVRTNTSQQIAARVTSSTTVLFSVLGYRDPRRRLF